MVRWMRSVRVSAGNFPQALQWAKEMAEFVKKYEGLSSIEVYMDTFGEVGTLRWFVDYPDLATLEKVQDQVRADQEYWKRINQTKGLFIEGSPMDVVMSAV
jgi:hypothetical protein